ncbi:hypothetical protein HDU93_002062, partial [Gonapodya sp. JEL0774]
IEWTNDEEQGVDKVPRGHDEVEQDREKGLLKVTGWIRGRNLGANRLVYLVDGGDFAIRRIESPSTHPSYLPAHTRPSSDASTSILALPNPDQRDDLVSSNPVDPLAQEQTWPTDEELAGDDEMTRSVAGSRMDGTEGGNGKKRKLPKGTSAYQAAWIPEDLQEDDDDDVEDEDGEEGGEFAGDAMSDGEAAVDGEHEELDGDGWEDMSDGSSIAADEVSVASDGEPASEAVDRTNSTRAFLAAQDLNYPDEVDTPRDTPARVRFAKYRGLADPRTSGWDPYENLPEDYGRCFAFEDWKRARLGALRRAGREDGEEKGANGVKTETADGDGMEVDTPAVKTWAEKGKRVTVVLEGVPKDWIASRNPRDPTFLVSLLPHEHKVSVSHAHLIHYSTHSSSDPIKSKDPLVVQVGFRRFRCNPVYSNLGVGSNGVSLHRRFFYHGAENQVGKEEAVATWFGPVCWDRAGVLAWRIEKGSDVPTLIATGTLLPSDVTRVVAKRIVLSGHPYKINKKTVVARYMFFNPEDIDYFKPVQLRTKYGRSGTILESIG